jgi:hypothetical protein
MRKLLAALALALGMSLAQSYYAGGHVGLFGSSGINVFNGGIHVGAALGKDLPEVRLGADFTSVLGFLITGINADVLLPLSLSGSQVQPYVGAGGNVWLFGGLTAFGLHATLGGRMAIPGAPLTGFVEVQPGYAFGSSGGGGSFFYYVKLGVNYGF